MEQQVGELKQLTNVETSLVVQWLRLQAPSPGGPGLLPSQGARSCILKPRPGEVIVKVLVAQLYPTLCDPMDYTAHGILRPECWSG